MATVTRFNTEKKYLLSPLCECQRHDNGNHFFPANRQHCARFAAFVVDGRKLCKQHAGDYLLAEALKEGK